MIKAARIAVLLLPWVAGALLLPGSRDAAFVVASKNFTESVILGELSTRLARDAGYEAIHRAQLGGTRVLWSALGQGEIDLYPEYTGTLMREIFADQDLDNEAALREAVEASGMTMSAPLGFNNTYAIGMRRSRADELGINKVSDLAAFPDLVLGFTNEFMDRNDGWPGLRERYGLAHTDVRGIEHELAYHALDTGAIDVTDLYATDAKIETYDLVILEDDLTHFPRYDAVLLYRNSLPQEHPDLVRALHRLEGTINEEKMIGLNARVELEGTSEQLAAARFLTDSFAIETEVAERSDVQRVLKHTREHLLLVMISMLGALVVAIPLGIWAAYRPRRGQAVLGIVGIIQTIPSLALLVILMQPLSALSNAFPTLQRAGISGIGNAPAIIALFLYSLLPIVRNTVSGLRNLPPDLRESARALGLPPRARLRLVELPMASPTILAGIKTAAVVNIGFATLGALIGAGGLGQPILTGIRLNDHGLILMGAVPAAGLALLAQGWFELVERLLVSRGLRLAPSR